MSTIIMTTTTDTTPETPTYEKGSWQESLQKSSGLLDRSAKARKTASNLLWKGATTGIEEWFSNSATDVNAEELYATLIEALGASRKGDASKIKTVAIARREHDLDLSVFPNLAKAYAEAVRLTKTQAAEASEDDAAEAAIENIDAPKTASTPEAAAKVLLSKGIDGAVVALLDALGADNFDAHRAFTRALSSEVASRVSAKAQAAAAEAKAERDAAKAAKDAERAAAKAAKDAEKAAASKSEKSGAPKPAATKAKPKKAGEPEVEDEGAEIEGDDMFAEIEDGETEGVVEDVAPQVKAKKRAVPVRRR